MPKPLAFSLEDDAQPVQLPPEPIPDLATTTGVNLDASIGDQLNNPPPVMEHVIVAARAEEISAPTDGEGEIWNPELHATGADGKGVLTDAGRWRKKRGRKPGQTTAKTNAAQSVVGTPGPTPEQKAELNFNATGAACASIMFTLGQAFGGREWAPRVDKDLDENAMLTSAFTDYARAKDMRDIPPGVALSFAIIAYVGPRFTMPETKSRLQKGREWLYGKIANYKAKKLARKHASQDRTP